jgi:uncharacterized membrane protein YvbJ
MHGSRSKIPSKKSRQACCAEGFNSGVKALIFVFQFFLRTICLVGPEKIVTNFKRNVSSADRVHVAKSNDYVTYINLHAQWFHWVEKYVNFTR